MTTSLILFTTIITLIILCLILPALYCICGMLKKEKELADKRYSEQNANYQRLSQQAIDIQKQTAKLSRDLSWLIEAGKDNNGND